MRLGLLVLVIAALGATEARAAVVTLQQKRPQPATVRVYAGDTVVWLNADRAAHRVIPASRGWSAVRIAALSAGRSRFARPGRYRYTVDRARAGMVVVTQRPARRTAPLRTMGFMADVTTSLSYPIGDCRDSWTFAGRFTIPRSPGRGVARGSGLAAIWDQPTCPFEIAAPTIERVTFNVLGRQIGRSVELRFALTRYEPGSGVSWAGLNAVFGIGVGTPAPRSGGGPLVLTPAGTSAGIAYWSGMGAWSTPTSESQFVAEGAFSAWSD